MTIDNNVREENLHYEFIREKLQKYQLYHQTKLTKMNNLQVKKHYLLIKAK